jgi:hypothetical protein
MPDSDAPQENDPWADLPTPEQAALTPPPLPTVEIRPPVEDDPNPPAVAPALPPDSTAASQDTVSLHIPTEPVEPPPTVFTGPPTGLADPTVAVPPIVAAPDFGAEAPPEPDEPSETPDEAAAPLVDRTGRDTAAVVWAGLGILIWVGAIGAAWWALTRGADPIVDEVSLPTPQTTFETLSDMVGDNGFWDNIVRTAFRLVGAVVLGASVGSCSRSRRCSGWPHRWSSSRSCSSGGGWMCRSSLSRRWRCSRRSASRPQPSLPTPVEAGAGPWAPAW